MSLVITGERRNLLLITQNLPAANRTVAGVDLLIGDGGREAAGHYPENVEDCVARSLAFALNDGADDGGLLYSVAWQLVTRCNSAGETADYRQPMLDYRRAYRGCGFRYRKWYTAGILQRNPRLAEEEDKGERGGRRWRQRVRQVSLLRRQA